MSSSADIVDSIWERFREEHKKLDLREQALRDERRELEILSVYGLKAELERLRESCDRQQLQLLDRQRDCEALRMENEELKKQLSSAPNIGSACRGRSGRPVTLGIEESSAQDSAGFSSLRLSPSPSKPRTPTSGSRVQLTKRYPTEEEESLSAKRRGEMGRKASLSQIFDVRKHVKQEMNIYRPVQRGSISPLPAYNLARMTVPGSPSDKAESQVQSAASKNQDRIHGQTIGPGNAKVQTSRDDWDAMRAKVEDLEEDDFARKGQGEDQQADEDELSEDGTAVSEVGSTRFL